MRFGILVLLLVSCAIQGVTVAQTPISSIYENIRNDPSPVIQSVYQLLNRYYHSRIPAKTMEQELNRMLPNTTPRERALLNMAMSYTKTDEEDFGFYHLRSAVSDAEQLPDSDMVKGVVYAEFGNYLFFRETSDLAVEFLRKSVPILEAKKPYNLEGTGFSLMNKIMRSFIKMGEEDSARLYMNLIIEHAKGYKDKIWISSACNNKGYSFFEANQPDSALFYYQLAKTYLNINDSAHHLFYENINENIAHIYARGNDLPAALTLLNNVIAVRLGYRGNAIAALHALNYYTDYCTQAGTPLAALRKFEEALPKLTLSGTDYETSIPYLNLKMKLARLAGNTTEYMVFANRLLEKERQKLEAEKQLLVNKKGVNKYVKSRNAIFEQQLEIERLQKEKLRQSVTYRNIFIVILVLLSGLILYAFYTSGKFKKRLLEAENEQLVQREKILDLENINLKTNIALKEKDISRVVADNRLRTEIKKEFLKKLEHLNNAEEKKVKNEIRKLRAELGQTIDNHDKIDLLQHNIEDINALFEKKLREAIPAITQSEMEICSLIRLGYNNTDIANITNKTPENIRVNKFRIKQKAGLGDMKDLEKLIKEM